MCTTNVKDRRRSAILILTLHWRDGHSMHRIMRVLLRENGDLKLRPNSSKIVSVSFRFLRLSRKRLTINAITHIFLERSFRDLSEKVWVVSLIVYRFRGKRKN